MDSIGGTIAKARERPGKPVSRRRLDEVETLAFLITRDAKLARMLQVCFDKLPDLAMSPEAHLVAEFVEWWQEHALLSPPVEGEKPREWVPLPWENKIHHRILDRVQKARAVMRGRPCNFPLPDLLLLPCETCGRIFETRTPHFARMCSSCQGCKPYLQTRRVHRLGSHPVWTGGFYFRGPERRKYVWPQVCDHPECVDFFSAEHPDDSYCPKHHSRVDALRARRRLEPKRTRYRFYPNRDVCEADENGKWFSYFLQVDGERRECAIGSEGYVAQDEIEFRYLAHAAAIEDRLLIIPVSDTPGA